MNLKTSSLNISIDFVTSRNLLFYVLCKEYIDFCKLNQFKPNRNEEEQFKFYMVIYKFLNGENTDIYEYISQKNDHVNDVIRQMVFDKMAIIMENDSEMNTYTHILELIANVYGEAHDRDDYIDFEKNNFVCKYSLVGIFLRKFSLSFQSLSFEQIMSLTANFQKVYRSKGIMPEFPPDCRLSEQSQATAAAKIESLSRQESREQVMTNLNRLYRRMMLGSKSSFGDQEDPNKLLDRWSEAYPDISQIYMLRQMICAGQTCDMAGLEREFVVQFATKYLGEASRVEEEQQLVQEFTDSSGVNTTENDRFRVKNSFRIHRCLAEICLLNANCFFQMGFKKDAKMLYEDALHAAVRAKDKDLYSKIKCFGDNLRPVNQNRTLVQVNKGPVQDPVSLPNIRNYLMQTMENNFGSLNQILTVYFSACPLSKDDSAICLSYLSIIFRSYGFESLANTYLLISMYLETLRKTENYVNVMSEGYSQLMSAFTSLGLYSKVDAIRAHLAAGNTDLDRRLAGNPRIEASLACSQTWQALLSLDYTATDNCLASLRQISLVEFGLKKVQLLVLEDNVSAAMALCSHLIELASHKRQQLGPFSLQGVVDPLLHQLSRAQHTSKVHPIDLEPVLELPHLDDDWTQNWSERNWALYECRCRFLMSCHQVNLKQRSSARQQLNVVDQLSEQHRFYQYRQLSTLMRSLTTVPGDSSSAGPKPLQILTNAVLRVWLRIHGNSSQHGLDQLQQLAIRSDDFVLQAQCLQVRKLQQRLGDANDTAHQLRLLLDNRMGSFRTTGFLGYVL